MIPGGINFSFDFPRIAKEMGFSFNLRTGGVDRKKIEVIDIDRLVEECDVYTVHDNLMNIVNYELENEEVNILNKDIIKLFKLAQLSIDYLMYSQQHLLNSVELIREEYNSCTEIKEQLSHELKKKELEVKVLKKKLKGKQEKKIIEPLISEHRYITSDYGFAGIYFKCEECPKAFVSAGHLNAHRLRRHAARSTPCPAPRPTPCPEPRSEPRPEPRPEPRSEPRLDPRAEPRLDPRPEPRLDPRPEPRLDPRPAPRPESHPAPCPAPFSSPISVSSPRPVFVPGPVDQYHEPHILTQLPLSHDIPKEKHEQPQAPFRAQADAEVQVPSPSPTIVETPAQAPSPCQSRTVTSPPVQTLLSASTKSYACAQTQTYLGEIISGMNLHTKRNCSSRLEAQRLQLWDGDDHSQFSSPEISTTATPLPTRPTVPLSPHDSSEERSSSESEGVVSCSPSVSPVHSDAHTSTLRRSFSPPARPPPPAPALRAQLAALVEEQLVRLGAGSRTCKGLPSSSHSVAMRMLEQRRRLLRKGYPNDLEELRNSFEKAVEETALNRLRTSTMADDESP